MIWIGIGIVVLMVCGLMFRFRRSPKRGHWPWYGLVGFLVILAAELLLGKGVHWVEQYFTPLVWTGYIFLVDAAVKRLTGHSRIHDSWRRMLWLALWSIPLWLVFEAYNLHLKNWVYFNLPREPFERYFGYGWAFATIWPALFETTDLLLALKFFQGSEADGGKKPPARWLAWSVIIGALLLVVPVVTPQPLAGYLFGMVWLGIIFLLDPINLWTKHRSLMREWFNGQWGGTYAMLLAGLVCGFLWEFWNYWALARWVYVFPIMQAYKIFQMPVIGFLGFPPFCVEAFVMFEFVDFLKPKANPEDLQR